jgi:ATP-binding cassette, subfamily B, bacterial
MPLPLQAERQTPLSTHWQLRLEKVLADGEQIEAWLETDLDPQLRFVPGLIAVTDRRLLAWHDGQTASWPLSSGLHLEHHDHAGVGTLALIDDSGRHAIWRYTMGRNLAALRLCGEFALQRDSRLSGAPVERASDELCPKCKAPLPPGEDECPICSIETSTPPSTWTLFRLWRFAKPYKGQLLLGFVLTLASTAATLVPPYLTMPLMDDILIPFQNGQPIDRDLVTLYLGGLFGAAMLAWILGWLRTYILALVSERIGRDLRTTTYQHLLGLSLEYFGGKRTGDLMARIGSETDRINVFLSLHLLDFATDVLMIAMTSAILFSINPWLALVTLLPLPFIAWLIHTVRDRLRTGFEKVDRVWAEVTNVLADTIPGIRVVKAFAQEKREAERFHEANRHNLALNDKLNRTWSLFGPTVTLMTEIGLLVVWAFGIWQISQNDITVGVLTAFLAYIGRFYIRLDSMSRIVSVTQKGCRRRQTHLRHP